MWHGNNDRLKYMFAHKNTCTDTHWPSRRRACVPSPCTPCLPLIGAFAAELSHWNTGCNSLFHLSIRPSLCSSSALTSTLSTLTLASAASFQRNLVYSVPLFTFSWSTQASGIIQNKIEIGVLVKAFQLFWIQWACCKLRCFALMSTTLEELAVESEINRLWIWILHINAKCDTSFLAANLCEHTKFNLFFFQATCLRDTLCLAFSASWFHGL